MTTGERIAKFEARFAYTGRRIMEVQNLGWRKSLNVRDAPNEDTAKKIGKLFSGELVKCLELKGDWCHHEEGWSLYYENGTQIMGPSRRQLEQEQKTDEAAIVPVDAEEEKFTLPPQLTALVLEFSFNNWEMQQVRKISPTAASVFSAGFVNPRTEPDFYMVSGMKKDYDHHGKYMKDGFSGGKFRYTKEIPDEEVRNRSVWTKDGWKKIKETELSVSASTPTIRWSPLAGLWTLTMPRLQARAKGVKSKYPPQYGWEYSLVLQACWN